MVVYLWRLLRWCFAVGFAHVSLDIVFIVLGLFTFIVDGTAFALSLDGWLWFAVSLLFVAWLWVYVFVVFYMFRLGAAW